jgi:hypothetical protein
VDRALRRWILTVSFFATCLATGSPALSAPKDTQASKLDNDAMNNDYLGTNFAQAETKLRKAIALCGAAACSPKIVGQLHRDLGVVLVAGLNKPADGKAEFAAALAADPAVQLDKDLTTPEIQAAFQAAQGGGAAPAPAPAAAAIPAAGTATASEKTTGMTHSIPVEQATLTPVPVYVEIDEGISVAKVQVKYKPFGATDWKSLELRRLGKGYGIEVPCLDIGSTTGDLRYYVQAQDENGDIVANSGTKTAPNKVPIKTELSGDPPHLPGRPPAAQCKDSADCPPGFPGCTKKKGKSWGASCETDTECESGLACKKGACEQGDRMPDGEAPPKSCEMDSDCDSGDKCGPAGTCESPGGPFKKNWLSLSVQADMSILSPEKDVCSADKQGTGRYYCIAEDNLQYKGRDLDANPIYPAEGNSVKGGFAFPPQPRVLLGYERVLGNNFMVGAKAGVAFNTSPDDQNGRGTRFLHLELRGSYWFGKQPFGSKGPRPFVLVALGMAEVHNKITVPIREEPQNIDDGHGYFETQNLKAWRRSGNLFAGVGGGVMFPVSKRAGFVAELKLLALFPDSGLTVSPAVGFMYGL